MNMNNLFKNSWRTPVILITITVTLILASAAELAAGVLVAPTAVILSDKSRTGRMTIQNPTNLPKEVRVAYIR